MSVLQSRVREKSKNGALDLLSINGNPTLLQPTKRERILA
jgi:hypothetical protein